MNRRSLVIVAAVSITAAALSGCAGNKRGQEHDMTGSAQGTSSAKAEWDRLSQQVAQTQALVGGTWTSVDTSARECDDGGAQWVITRSGPGIPAADRTELFADVEKVWVQNGWKPNRTTITGDAPGLQLRFPAGGVDDRGFFIELGSTEHGTTIQAQTACAPGDVDQLNQEQYAYNHTPGVTTASPTSDH